MALRTGLWDTHRYIPTPKILCSPRRIETRTYRIYDGLDIIADKRKWGGNMTIIEYESSTVKKSTGIHTSEKRLYVSSMPADTPQPRNPSYATTGR